MNVMTIVEGKVSSIKSDEFEESYKSLKNNSFPPGLLESFLLKDSNSDVYRIATIWESLEVLENFRKSMGEHNKVPTAVALFNKVGVEPDFKVFEIKHHILN